MFRVEYVDGLNAFVPRAAHLLPSMFRNAYFCLHVFVGEVERNEKTLVLVVAKESVYFCRVDKNLLVYPHQVVEFAVRESVVLLNYVQKVGVPLS